MNYIFILAILVIGLSGIAAQVMLLRELLVSFYGNELTLGLILANWIILEAFGVFFAGKFIDKIKNKLNIFVILQIIFVLTLPLSIYFARIVKSMLGVPFGEGIGLAQIFYSSLLIMLPVSFCHGALFSCGCNIYYSYIKEPVRSIGHKAMVWLPIAKAIGKVYAWETIGTIIGGIVLTYLLIPYLNSFQTAFIISIFNLIICLFFFMVQESIKHFPIPLRKSPKVIADHAYGGSRQRREGDFLEDISKILKYTILFLILVMAYLPLSGALNKMHNYAIKKQWKMQDVLDYRNSIYGNIVVVQKEEQRTFFYNGLPIITTPYPDITFVQEFGNLPLLFHPHPKDILVISGGAGGLINEILKHPIRKIDYAELDPLLIEMLEKYRSRLTQRELQDNRVNIINKDGRFFVKNTSHKYDIVLLGLSKPADLSTNRVFTQEFFALIKKRLNPDGILALYLPGSLTYLSSELRDLNACILNALKSTYSSVRIIPGDYNMFLASSSQDIMRVDPNLITQRINQDNIKADILVPAYLNYRLDKRHLEWFTHSSIGATRKINQDFMPTAVYQMLVLWNKQFSSGFSHILEALGNLDLKVILALIFAVTLLLFFIFCYKHNRIKLSITYSIATTGLFGMLMNLILIFSFQVIYGYLYHRIGLLISIFMGGTALGSIFMTHNTRNIKNSLSLFVKLEAVIVLFSYLAALIITRFLGYTNFSALIFMALFFISGLLIGLEFPLATKMYLGERGQVGLVAGLLYFSDLIGGWLAGIVGAVVFLPVLGLFNTCMVIIFLKLSSLLLLVIFSKRLTKVII
jgi:spermidine synthase